MGTAIPHITPHPVATWTTWTPLGKIRMARTLVLRGMGDPGTGVRGTRDIQTGSGEISMRRQTRMGPTANNGQFHQPYLAEQVQWSSSCACLVMVKVRDSWHWPCEGKEGSKLRTGVYLCIANMCPGPGNMCPSICARAICACQYVARAGHAPRVCLHACAPVGGSEGSRRRGERHRKRKRERGRGRATRERTKVFPPGGGWGGGPMIMRHGVVAQGILGSRPNVCYPQQVLCTPCAARDT
jgi:hypothetical protein